MAKTEELKKQLPVINPYVITGVKGHLKSPSGKEDTGSKIGIDRVSTGGNIGSKEAIAEAVTQYFTRSGPGPDRLKQLAEYANPANIPGKSAPFTPQNPTSQ